MEQTKIHAWRTDFIKKCSLYQQQCSNQSKLKNILKRWVTIAKSTNDPSALWADISENELCPPDYLVYTAYYNAEIKMDIEIFIDDVIVPLKQAAQAAKNQVPIVDKSDCLTIAQLEKISQEVRENREKQEAKNKKTNDRSRSRGRVKGLFCFKKQKSTRNSFLPKISVDRERSENGSPSSLSHVYKAKIKDRSTTAKGSVKKLAQWFDERAAAALLSK